MDDDNLDLNSNYLVVMKNSHLRCEMTIIIFKHYQERVVLSSASKNDEFSHFSLYR